MASGLAEGTGTAPDSKAAGPGVAAAGLLVFITALGFFVTPTLLGSRRETMIAQIIINQIDETLDWGFAGAVAVLLLVASILVFWLFDRMLGHFRTPAIAPATALAKD